MKPDDQVRVGVFVILALSAHCVLTGLVSESVVRSWAFHAVGVILAVWALVSFTDWSTRLASLGGLLACANDVLLVRELDLSMRLVIPSTVLCAASGFVAFRVFPSVSLPTPALRTKGQGRTRGLMRSGVEGVASQFGNVPGAVAAIASVPNLRKEIRNSSQDPAWVPFLLIGGSIATFFSLSTAKWISTEALLGLIRRTYGFSDLRTIYEELGVKYFARVYYFEWGYLVSYAAAIASIVVATAVLTKKFQIDRYFKTGMLCVVVFAFISHTALVVGLNSAAEELFVLSGAWVGSLGLAGSVIGIWLSGRR